MRAKVPKTLIPILHWRKRIVQCPIKQEQGIAGTAISFELWCHLNREQNWAGHQYQSNHCLPFAFGQSLCAMGNGQERSARMGNSQWRAIPNSWQSTHTVARQLHLSNQSHQHGCCHNLIWSYNSSITFFPSESRNQHRHNHNHISMVRPMWMSRWVLTKCGGWRSVKGRRMPTDPPVAHSLPTTHIDHHHQLAVLAFSTFSDFLSYPFGLALISGTLFPIFSSVGCLQWSSWAG